MVTDYASQLVQTDMLSQERLHALSRTIQRMNSVYELPELLTFILDQVLKATRGQRGYLLLAQDPAADEDEPRLEVKAVSGAEVDVSEIKADIYRFVSGNVVRDVLQTGEARVTDDIGQDVRYIEHLGSTTLKGKWPSIVAIPLKVADRLIGLIYVEHRKPGAFLKPDLEFVNDFAAQAAVAVDRAQQSQRRVEELERLNQVSRSVVRVLDLDQVLVHILREVTHLLEVETGSVLLLDERSEELVFRLSVQEGRTVHIAQRLKVGQGVAGWVAEHGEPLLVPDVLQDARWYGEVESGFATRSILCAPLKIDDHVIGVLQALNKKAPLGFTDRDLALLSAFATSATVAIENARLFAEARQARELRALNEMAFALSSTLELETVLETGLEKALDVMGVEAGAVGLVDDKTGELVAAAVQGWRGEGVPAGTRLPASEGLVGQVADGGEILVVDDTTHDLPPLFYDEGVCAVALAPMRARGQVVGVLSAMSYTPHTFTPEEKDILSGIGGMFGVAVENARLYEKVHRNLRELAEAKERMAKAEAVVEIGDIALNLTHELSNRISIIPVTVGFIQTNCEEELRDPYLKKKLDVIERVANEGKTIIQRIRGPFELTDEEPLRVSDCLAEALNEFQIKSGIKVVERHQPDLPPVMADREKLVQALCHIIGNALEAMGDRETGQVWLATRQREDGLVEAVISDDGPGIPPEILGALFVPGGTTKKDKGGLGLGLWWTDIYVRRLGGQVKVQSTPGQGTVVSIRLPAAQETST